MISNTSIRMLLKLALAVLLVVCDGFRASRICIKRTVDTQSNSVRTLDRARLRNRQFVTAAKKIEDELDSVTGTKSKKRKSTKAGIKTEDDKLITTDSSEASLKSRSSANIQVEKVPRGSPLQQKDVPPEVVFFGEPRNPPPVQAINDLNFHGTLLGWARHGNIMPRTSKERLEYVFPRGRLHPDATIHRFKQPESLTYQQIYNSFTEVMDDLEKSKAFIDANIDLVPSMLFQRAISGEKLAAQSRNQLQEMEQIKLVRERYITAHDQVFFPFNMEIKKAETRVMTFLGRPEVQNYAQEWDSAELSMYFLVLLTARLKWDKRASTVLSDIRKQVDSTMSFMKEGVQQELLNSRLRSPGATAELYANSSLSVQQDMPELYSRLRPEVQIVHETYLMNDKASVKKYIEEVFCPRANISPQQLAEKLKILESSTAAIQGKEYMPLRKRVGLIFECASSAEELQLADKWYKTKQREGYDFKTYAPDQGTLPRLVEMQQRMRDSGSAFKNFYVDTLKGATVYSNAFTDARPRAAAVGDWLKRDANESPLARSYEDRVEAFRAAYCRQAELRQAAESRMDRLIPNRMAEHDKVYFNRMFKVTDPFSEAAQLDEMRQREEAVEKSKRQGKDSTGSKNVLEYSGDDE